jgi:hypothetical protein
MDVSVSWIVCWRFCVSKAREASENPPTPAFSRPDSVNE